MSISCQYDSMRYPFFLSDLTRNIPVEGELSPPDSWLPIEKVNWGSFEVGVPNLTVYEDLLVVSGKVYPFLLYLTKSDENRGASETDVTGEQFAIERRECGARWINDNGVSYEERITVPGLHPGMLVEADIIPLNASFEDLGSGKIRFHGQLEVTIHAVESQDTQVVNDVTAQAPLRINVTKEPVKLEEIVDIRKETIPIQTPLILSNLKPGAARILTYQTRPIDVNWESGRGKVFVKGFLEVAMVYVGCDDDGHPTEVFAHEWNRAAGTAVPFETVISTETTDMELTVVPRIMLYNSKLEMKTPREMRYRVDVECEAMISKMVQKEVVTDADCGSEQVIDVLKKLVNFDEYLGEKSGAIHLETTVSLPNGEVPERLLVWEGTPREISLEAAEDRVLIDGNLDLRLIYAADSADGFGVQVASWDKANNNSIPLAGVIDFSGVQPGTLLRGQVQVESLNLELTGDKAVQVTGNIALRLMARSPRALMALKDCAAVETVDPSTRPSMLFYVVQPGDSLWKIARQYQTTVDALARINQIVNPDRVDIGLKLIIPKLVV